MEKAEKCPNFEQCLLIKSNNILLNQSDKRYYTEHFCLAPNSYFTHCKRYQTSVALHFCPDFVLPDTALSVDEIIDKYEKGYN